jgi:hypothetical protein
MPQIPRDRVLGRCLAATEAEPLGKRGPDCSWSEGRPIRVFYAFDPRRTAVLLMGGDKTGDGRFYEQRRTSTWVRLTASRT